MSGKYDDILYLPHHVSPTRQRMTMAERAAQFSPFAALVGYGEAIRETGRAVGQQMELSEEEKAVLDQKQQIILAALEQGEEPEVTVTYFQPDRKKDGGEYVSYTGSIKKYKEIENTFVFGGGKEIPLSGIVDLTGTVFQGHFDD
ncbi:MAG: hypothetical protein HFF10_11890 [Angelakisella sp.]|jgi:hypothetical protein|nr:hypothetical protein [Angelakisella sp.]